GTDRSGGFVRHGSGSCQWKLGKPTLNNGRKEDMTNHRVRSALSALGAVALLALSAAPAIAQSPVRGGEITAGVLELPQTLDPLLGNSASIDPLTLDLIYDTLI